MAAMTTGFEDYRDRYPTIRMERSPEGILEMALHHRGGPYVWDFDGVVQDEDRSSSGGAHADLAEAAGMIAQDPHNRVVILTGTGDQFSGPRSTVKEFPKGDAIYWERLRRTGTRLIANLLEIQVPVISCINGPIYRHAEIPLTGDIVLASEDALMVDSGHFPNRTVPGDGIGVLIPFLMGWNRGRYFHLMGTEMSAQEMKEVGLVNEVMPREHLLPRARHIAGELAQKSDLTLRYTRLVLTAPLKTLVQQYLGYSFALEALAAVDESSHIER
jgi:enoyl-CoA hydratase/carnithine racemase